MLEIVAFTCRQCRQLVFVHAVRRPGSATKRRPQSQATFTVALRAVTAPFHITTGSPRSTSRASHSLFCSSTFGTNFLRWWVVVRPVVDRVAMTRPLPELGVNQLPDMRWRRLRKGPDHPNVP